MMNRGSVLLQPLKGKSCIRTSQVVTIRRSRSKLRVCIVGSYLSVVWDSKSNGHNTTLWAPGFTLDDIRDVIEMGTKWLAVPVVATWTRVHRFRTTPNQ